MEQKLGPEALLQELRELQKIIPLSGEGNIDAETILCTLAEMRKSLPAIDSERRSSDRYDGRAMFLEGEPAETEEDFAWAAVLEALDSFAADVHVVAQQARERAVETALQIYYATEEAARDPENAELIPYMQEMREAYEHDYGKPIPPRKPGGE